MHFVKLQDLDETSKITLGLTCHSLTKKKLIPVTSFLSVNSVLLRLCQNSSYANLEKCQFKQNLLF